MSSDNPQREVLWAGRFLDVVRINRWEFVQRKNITGIVGIVPVTNDGKLVLLEQYRPPIGGKVIELPAGLVGDVPGNRSEPLEAAARRELHEETGYEARRMEVLFEGCVTPGLCDETISFFLATDLYKTADGGGDETEDIIVHEVPLGAVMDFLAEQQRKGFFIDLKVYSALFFLQREIVERQED
ncbi:MAG: NUDIX hydrolase [Phycisphaerae bacterium]|nr:NUDIX hydrolase [Phycisphaerae bacterium]